MRHLTFAFTVIAFAAALAACDGGSSQSSTGPTSAGTESGTAGGALPVGDKPFKIDPAEFTTQVTNRFWPMKIGDHWVYRETDAEGEVQRNDVVVTDKKKTVMGIDVLAVHDTVRLHGGLTEDTYDWYAQDAKGNLWYFGEDTAEYENGKLKTKEGSWEAGVNGAMPGIIMAADPQVGMTYREEYYKGHAEDGAQIISTDALAKVPYGRFDHGVQTRNFSGIEPNVIEEKIYAKGVGVVLEITVSGGSDRSELISFTTG
jgi:hypothetical protein